MESNRCIDEKVRHKEAERTFGERESLVLGHASAFPEIRDAGINPSAVTA